MKKRPYESSDGIRFSTCEAFTVARMLGDLFTTHSGVGILDDEARALFRFYGLECRESDPVILRAGDEDTVITLTKQDGLRVMAFLARFLEQGEDPVQLVARGLAALGFDVQIEET